MDKVVTLCESSVELEGNSHHMNKEFLSLSNVLVVVAHLHDDLGKAPAFSLAGTR